MNDFHWTKFGLGALLGIIFGLFCILSGARVEADTNSVLLYDDVPETHIVVNP